MTTTFEKNCYEPHETVEADVKIDQKDCKVDMTKIALRLEQRMTMKADGFSKVYNKVLISHNYDGVKAGEDDPVKKELKLDLSKLKKKNMPKKKKKKGVEKDTSPEDIFLGE